MELCKSGRLIAVDIEICVKSTGWRSCIACQIFGQASGKNPGVQRSDYAILPKSRALKTSSLDKNYIQIHRLYILKLDPQSNHGADRQVVASIHHIPVSQAESVKKFVVLHILVHWLARLSH